MTGARFWLRRDGTPPGPVVLRAADLPPTLDAAYLALAAEQAGRAWGGWKIGGSNHASRAAFGVREADFGALAAAGVLESGPGPAAALAALALPECRGEVEIALRLAPGLDGYDAWCLALEMPATDLTNLSALGVVALVADRCAAGALLLGPVRSGPLPDLGAARFVQVIDGAVAADSGLDSLVGTPDSILDQFLTLARSHGAALAPGQWVATGGITPCLTYAAGARVEVRLDGLPGTAPQIALTMPGAGR